MPQNTVTFDPTGPIVESAAAGLLHYGQSLSPLPSGPPTFGSHHPAVTLGMAGIGFGAIIGVAGAYYQNNQNPTAVVLNAAASTIGTVASYAWTNAALQGAARVGLIALGTAAALGAIAVTVAGAVVGTVAFLAVAPLLNYINKYAEEHSLKAPADFGPQPCFPAGTPITLANGRTVFIETIRVDAQVAATWHNGVALSSLAGPIDIPPAPGGPR